MHVVYVCTIGVPSVGLNICTPVNADEFMNMCAWVYGGQRMMSLVVLYRFLLQFFVLFFESVSLTEPRAHGLAEQWQTSRILSVPSPW